MAEEQTPRPLSFKDIYAQLAQSSTPESRRAAAIAALGGAQTKRAREYVDLMDRLSAKMGSK